MRVVTATLVSLGVVLSTGLACSQEQSKKTSVNVPQDALTEIAYLVGNWTMEGKSDEGESTAKYSTRWAPGKHACVSNSMWSGPAGKSRGLGITGWDAGKKQITTVEFYSSGFNHILCYTIKSPTVWEGEGNGVDGDGNVFKRQIRLEKQGPNEFKWMQLDEEGKEPELVLHFRKVQKKAKGRKDKGSEKKQ